MNAPRLVLCLALLASSLGFAQASSPPSDDPLSPPPLVPASEAPEPPIPTSEQPEAAPPEGEIIPRPYEPQLPTSPRFDTGRIAFEALGGVVGGIGMGLGSALALGGILSLSTSCSGGETACGLVIGIIALPAVALGIPLGVYAAGNLMGGQGRFLPTLAGMAAGLGASLILGLTGSAALTTLGIVTLPIAGAIVGYERSHPDAPLPPAFVEGSGSGDSSPDFQWTPLLGLTPRGGFMGGIAARF